MREIDFNDLPRPTRERFVRSLVSDSPAARPICGRVSQQRSAFAWYVMLVLALGGLAALAAFRFGRPEAPVQDVGVVGGYVAGWAVVAIAVAMLARRRALKGSLPFAPGVYVFPVDLVDARTRRLVLHPLSDLQEFDVVHHARNGKYSHAALRFIFPTTSFSFEVAHRSEVDAEVVAVHKARANLAKALEGGGLADLAAVDPFAEARARHFQPANDHGLLARGRPTWIRFIWAITIIVALTLGGASWRSRNWLSDERAFERVSSTLDVHLAEAYRRAGGLRVADVEGSLLPRAYLAAAKREPAGFRRAEATERVLETFPKSGIEKEARAVLAEAQHAEFASRSTVADLRAFMARWPNAADVPAAKARIAELYRQTLTDFHKHANVTDKSVVPVVDAMLAYAEERGAALEVRFRRRSAATLAAAEKVLEQGGRAESVALSLALSVKEASRRETALVAALQRSLREVFPADVVALRLGAPLEGPSPIPGTPPLAVVAAPTFVVDYEVGWPGTTYVSRESTKRLVGLAVSFDITIQVPNEARVLYVGTKVDPPESLPIQLPLSDPAFQALLLPGAPQTSEDARIYDVMLLRAFDRFTARWTGVFFDPNVAAAREAAEPTAQ